MSLIDIYTPASVQAKVDEIQTDLYDLSDEIHAQQFKLPASFATDWNDFFGTVQSWIDTDPAEWGSSSANDQADSYLAQLTDWRARLIAAGGTSNTPTNPNPSPPDAVPWTSLEILAGLFLVAYLVHEFSGVI